jgi:tetratricopeptide (TPR) repeat protein
MTQGNSLLDEALRAQGAGRAQEAAQLYGHVLRYNPDDLVALNNLGLLLGGLKQYGESEALLARATRVAPGRADAWVNLAVVLSQQNKLDDAIGCCRKALAIAPENRHAQNTLAAALADAGRHDEAIALLERIVRKRPGYATGHAYLGTLYAKRGLHEQAVASFARAVQADPEDGVSLAAAGECLLLLGRAAEALPLLERALALEVYDVRALALKTLALAETGRTDEERALSDPGRLIHRMTLADLGYAAGDIDALNRGLAEFAAAEAGMQEDPAQYATYKGWHSTTNLAGARNAAVDALKQVIRRGFDARLARLAEEDPAHPFVRAAPKDYALDLWCVRLSGGGGKMLPHIHLAGWLSGVYYVEVPGVVDDPAAGRAGWIEFGPPRADIRLSRRPLARAVKPEPGLLLTFPSYFWHDTVPLPVENREQRLIFSWDHQPVRA